MSVPAEAEGVPSAALEQPDTVQQSSSQHRLCASIARLSEYEGEFPLVLDIFPTDTVDTSFRYWCREGDSEPGLPRKSGGADPSKILVFFHGLGCSKFDFVGAVDRLPRSWTLLALDWPRHVAGHATNRHTTLEDFFLTFSNLVEYAHAGISRVLAERRLASEKYVLVGHSMGGKIAVQYASKYVHELQALVNVEGHLHVSDPRMASEIVREIEGYLNSTVIVEEARRAIQSRAAGGEDDVGQEMASTDLDARMSLAMDAFLGRERLTADVETHAPAKAKWLQTAENLMPPAVFLAQAKAIVDSQQSALQQNAPQQSDDEAVNRPDAPDSARPDLWQEFLDLPEKLHKVAYMYGEKNRDRLQTSLGEMQRANDEMGTGGKDRYLGEIQIGEVSMSGHFPFFDNGCEFYEQLGQVLGHGPDQAPDSRM